jgi:hypothetical protein
MSQAKLTSHEWRSICRILSAPTGGRPIVLNREDVTLLLESEASGLSYWQLTDRPHAMRLYARRKRLDASGLWPRLLSASAAALARWRDQSKNDDAERSDLGQLMALFDEMRRKGLPY